MSNETRKAYQVSNPKSRVAAPDFCNSAALVKAVVNNIRVMAAINDTLEGR